MTADEETEQGRAFFQELLWIHSVIRRDLGTLQSLAQSVLEGLDPADVQAELKRLETNGPLWQLKVNCLAYCRIVHGHHNFEDAAWFPSLRAANPEIGPVIDRLEEDHRKVSDLLDEVESAAASLTESDTGDSRARVAGALNDLATDLLLHLDYEEESAGPTIRRLRHL